MVEKYFHKCTIELHEPSSPWGMSLHRIKDVFAEYLTLLHVPHYDYENGTVSLMPVAYNTLTNTLQRYDSLTDTFVDVVISGGGGGSDPVDFTLQYRASAVSTNLLLTDRVLEMTTAATTVLITTQAAFIPRHIKNSSAGTVTIVGGVYTIDGAPTHPIPAGECRTVFYNGSQFIVI